MSQTPLLKTLHWLSISPSVQIQTEYGLQGPSGHGLSLPFYLICWLMMPGSYSSQRGRELEVQAPYVTRILVQMKLWDQTFYSVVSYVLGNIHRAISYDLDLYNLPQWSKNINSDVIFVNNGLGWYVSRQNSGSSHSLKITMQHNLPLISNRAML